MVITELTEALIADGAKVVERLDESGVEIPTALWIRFPNLDSWKLAISLPELTAEGPKKAYRIVQRALADLDVELEDLSLEDVAVLKPDAPLLDLLRVAIQTGPGLSHISFTGNVINGQLFPDSHIYRVS